MLKRLCLCFQMIYLIADIFQVHIQHVDLRAMLLLHVECSALHSSYLLAHSIGRQNLRTGRVAVERNSMELDASSLSFLHKFVRTFVTSQFRRSSTILTSILTFTAAAKSINYGLIIASPLLMSFTSLLRIPCNIGKRIFR